MQEKMQELNELFEKVRQARYDVISMVPTKIAGLFEFDLNYVERNQHKTEILNDGIIEIFNDDFVCIFRFTPNKEDKKKATIHFTMSDTIYKIENGIITEQKVMNYNENGTSEEIRYKDGKMFIKDLYELLPKNLIELIASIRAKSDKNLVNEFNKDLEHIEIFGHNVDENEDGIAIFQENGLLIFSYRFDEKDNKKIIIDFSAQGKQYIVENGIITDYFNFVD